jgi:hypothetical protein
MGKSTDEDMMSIHSSASEFMTSGSRRGSIRSTNSLSSIASDNEYSQDNDKTIVSDNCTIDSAAFRTMIQPLDLTTTTETKTDFSHRIENHFGVQQEDEKEEEEEEEVKIKHQFKMTNQLRKPSTEETDFVSNFMKKSFDSNNNVSKQSNSDVNKSQIDNRLGAKKLSIIPEISNKQNKVKLKKFFINSTKKEQIPHFLILKGD